MATEEECTSVCYGYPVCLTLPPKPSNIQQNLLTSTLISRMISSGSLLTRTLSRRSAWVEDVVVIARVQKGHTHTGNSRSRTSVDVVNMSSIELLHSKGCLKRFGQGRHHNMVRVLTRWSDVLKAPIFQTVMSIKPWYTQFILLPVRAYPDSYY